LIAPDGSPVEVFRALPPGPAPALIASQLAPASAVLDLGAGAGRLSVPLAALGHRVTAVDVSPEMLAAIDGPYSIDGQAAIERVCAAIEGLALGRCFDAVVLASYLVNHPSASAYLATCTRHLAGGGAVFVQRYDVEWVRDATPDTVTAGNVTVTVDRFAFGPDPERFTMRVEYEIGADRWRQEIDARLVDDGALAALAAAAGLEIERWLDEFRTWARLRPASGGATRDSQPPGPA
jgi:SAM-dependent methyltransferase